MRRARLCCFSFAAVLFFAARITGRREFFLLLFMLVFTAAYALALSLWTIFSFTFVQELSHATSKKGLVEHLKIHIHNDKPFPFTLMRIEVQTVSPSEKAALRFNLAPRDSIRFEAPVYCAYRGEFPVGMTVIDVCDIFGLFEIRFDLRALPYYRQRMLKIYPKLVSLRVLPSAARDTKLAGGSGATDSSGGDSFSFPREYRAGDALRQIHWTASARCRKLISKGYDTPLQESVIIAVDNAESGLEGEELLRYADLACECACAIARYCSGKGRKVRLVSAEDKGIHPSREGMDFTAVYNALALLSFSAGGSLCESLRLETKKDGGLRGIYVLSRRRDEELTRLLAEYAKSGCDAKYLLLGAQRRAQGRDTQDMRGIACAELEYGGDVAAVLEGLM